MRRGRRTSAEGTLEPADPVSEEVAAPVGAGEPADDAESTDESGVYG